MKALLFDADGVVLKKDEFFSEKFIREYSVPREKVLAFFKGPFGACQAGSKDLKIELAPFLLEWQWPGDVDSFLEYWFQDVVVDEVTLAQIQLLRARGIKCYLASNNEVYRGRIIESVLGDQLDGYFFSADLKSKKEEPAYFTYVLDELGLSPSDVLFIDNEEKNVASAASVGIDARIFSSNLITELIQNLN